MSEKIPIVKWDKLAFDCLVEACNFIEQDSLANAEKVKNEILKATGKLAYQPERYPPDKYKRNNPGNYRAFEIYSYRISYCYLESEIIILRLKGVKQKPAFY